jgi:hypothetical protein
MAGVDVMITICGFIVVRKPDMVQRTYKDGKQYKPNLRTGKKTYHGSDRLPWEDLDNGFYTKTISTPLLQIRETITAENMTVYS